LKRRRRRRVGNKSPRLRPRFAGDLISGEKLVGVWSSSLLPGSGGVLRCGSGDRVRARCLLRRGSPGCAAWCGAAGSPLGMDGVYGWLGVWLVAEGPGRLQQGGVASSPGPGVKELGEHGRYGRRLRPIEDWGSDPVLRSRWLLRLTNAIVQGVPSSPGAPLLCVFSDPRRWWLASTRRSGIGSREDQGRQSFSLFGVFCSARRSQLFGLYPSCIIVFVCLLSKLSVLFSYSYKYK
jgi:hypothetical protein